MQSRWHVGKYTFTLDPWGMGGRWCRLTCVENATGRGISMLLPAETVADGVPKETQGFLIGKFGEPRGDGA